MSYQALARKWRPNTFTDVVGQEHVINALSHSLSMNRLHHAYLFSGTRGVGKTSIARLFAKGLNCETGITDKPCGCCANCQDIEQGRFVDLLEIDAASRTKVEDTREILDNVQYLPTRGRVKVYLIDEVHMLSKSSFNALLKTLEEPPEYVKFLLATTDPQKLPATILSRCLHLHLCALDNEQIQSQVERILTAESISFEPAALSMLAQAAAGSVRDALSLTDQAIAIDNGKISTQGVMAMLGLIDSQPLLLLLQALINSDVPGVLAQLQHLSRLGAAWDNVLAESLALLHRIALFQLLPPSAVQQPDEIPLRRMGAQLTPQALQLYYQFLLTGRKELAFAPTPKMGVEMAFLRALAFSPTDEAMSSPAKGSQAVTTTEVSSPSSSLDPEKREPLLGIRAVKEQVSSPHNSEAHIADTAAVIASDVGARGGRGDAGSETTNSDEEERNLSPALSRLLKTRSQLLQGDKKEKKSDVVTLPPQLPVFATQRAQKLGSAKRYNSSSKEGELSTAAPPVTPYQWRSTLPDERSPNSTTLKTLRETLEHEKTPEMLEKLKREASECDEWSREIEALSLSRLMMQLALNTFRTLNSPTEICLHLRPSQSHLNTNDAAASFTKAISDYTGYPVTVKIIDDDDRTYKTPLEWRQTIYQKKLDEARRAVASDKNIQLLCQYFDAQIEEESIRLL